MGDLIIWRGLAFSLPVFGEGRALLTARSCRVYPTRLASLAILREDGEEEESSGICAAA